jgi:hypothetical protein
MPLAIDPNFVAPASDRLDPLEHIGFVAAAFRECRFDIEKDGLALFEAGRFGQIDRKRCVGDGRAERIGRRRMGMALGVGELGAEKDRDKTPAIARQLRARVDLAGILGVLAVDGRKACCRS